MHSKAMRCQNPANVTIFNGLPYWQLVQLTSALIASATEASQVERTIK